MNTYNIKLIFDIFVKFILLSSVTATSGALYIYIHAVRTKKTWKVRPTRNRPVSNWKQCSQRTFKNKPQAVLVVFQQQSVLQVEIYKSITFFVVIIASDKKINNSSHRPYFSFFLCMRLLKFPHHNFQQFSNPYIKKGNKKINDFFCKRRPKHGIFSWAIKLVKKNTGSQSAGAGRCWCRYSPEAATLDVEGDVAEAALLALAPQLLEQRVAVLRLRETHRALGGRHRGSVRALVLRACLMRVRDESFRTRPSVRSSARRRLSRPAHAAAAAPHSQHSTAAAARVKNTHRDTDPPTDPPCAIDFCPSVWGTADPAQTLFEPA